MYIGIFLEVAQAKQFLFARQPNRMNKLSTLLLLYEQRWTGSRLNSIHVLRAYMQNFL